MPRARRSGCRPGRAARPRARSPPASSCSKCVLSASRICSPDRQHRVQARHRVLEDHRDLACRACRAAAPIGEVEQVAALEDRRCPSGPGPPRGRMPRIASAVTLLPQPDSPTIPSVSPGAMSNEIAVDGVDGAAARPELDAQVLDSRAAARARSAGPCSFGSRASRRPSPIRLKPSTEITIATPGKTASNGARGEVLLRVGRASSPTRAWTGPAARARGSRARRRR